MGEILDGKISKLVSEWRSGAQAEGGKDDSKVWEAVSLEKDGKFPFRLTELVGLASVSLCELSLGCCGCQPRTVGTLSDILGCQRAYANHEMVCGFP